MTTKDVKFWLEEKDLKTPIHDEMVLWTFTNAEKVIEQLSLFPSSPQKIQRRFRLKEDRNYGREDLDAEWDWSPGTLKISEEYKKELDKEVVECNKDLEDGWEKERALSNLKYANDNLKKVQASKKQIEEDYRIFNKELKEKKLFLFDKKIEFNLSQPNGWNIGFIDLMVHVIPNIIKNDSFEEIFEDNKKDYSDGERIFFEIKPEVKSIGETMRQINFYRKYTRGAFVLVTKTKGLKEIFKTQDVYVVEYEKEVNDGKKR